MNTVVIFAYIIITILMTIGFGCIGYDLGCKDTEKDYKNRKCNRCSNYKTTKCPNSNKCYSMLGKPYFRILKNRSDTNDNRTNTKRLKERFKKI